MCDVRCFSLDIPRRCSRSKNKRTQPCWLAPKLSTCCSAESPARRCKYLVFSVGCRWFVSFFGFAILFNESVSCSLKSPPRTWCADEGEMTVHSARHSGHHHSPLTLSAEGDNTESCNLFLQGGWKRRGRRKSTSFKVCVARLLRLS